jgi:hypothetical protein
VTQLRIAVDPRDQGSEFGAGLRRVDLGDALDRARQIGGGSPVT